VSAAATLEALSQAQDQDAERRQLTVLFCDLVGSTSICEKLDPEDHQELIRSYSTACAGMVERFEGFVAEYLGDGILAYFGYPHAHEDDAERAVKAALDIVATLRRPGAVPRQGDDIDIAVRIGIATGLVVTGDLVRKGSVAKKLVVGQTLNLAARLQNLASGNQIVIAASTHRLLGQLFECQSLGPQQLKGFTEPVNAWRVLRCRQLEGRFQALHSAALTPMVDREEPLAQLLAHWRLAERGRGRTVLLSGEPGIGKSRVVQALREQLASLEHTVEYYQCASYFRTSALHPIIEQIEQRAGFEQYDEAEQRFAKLLALLSQLTDDVDSVLPPLAALLSIPAEGRYALPEQTPQRQKEKTFAILVQYLANRAEEKPLLMIFEDVHWIDPSSLELLGLVVQRAAGLRLMLVCTARPEFTTPWTQQHVFPLALDRLQPEHSRLMLRNLSGDRPLPISVIGSILVKTDGIPLFLEELTKTLLETGPGDSNVATLAIPSTLKDSLMARLDQLAIGKQVAQVGAAIGREFSYELLAAVALLNEEGLQSGLRQLISAGLVTRQGESVSTLGDYAFKHALIQEVAYNSLLRRKRRTIHARIAAVLEQRFARIADTKPEIIAHHYQAAQLPTRAAEYWFRAGKRASQRSANIEAIDHLGRGLALVEKLSDTIEHRQLELNLLLTLGATLINTKGPGHSDVQRTYERARELCAVLPDTPQYFPAYWGLWRSCFDLGTARKIADKLLGAARGQQGSEFRLQAHHAQWATLFNLGRLSACCHHIDAGLALYSAREHASSATVYGGHDAKVCGHGEAALALWLLGFTDRAVTRADQGLRWGRTLDHPASLAHAYDYALMLRQYRREPRILLTESDGFISFAADNNLPHYHARGLALRGWALAELGQQEAGAEILCEGIEAQRDTGIEDDFPVFLDMLAEVYYHTGRHEKGLEVLAEALTLAERSGMRHWWAELHRRRGQLLLAYSRDAQGEAELCFREALRLAKRQSAKALQLRAAMSLTRLCLQQGRPEAARETLASICRELSEGWDTVDLLEARILLGELPREQRAHEAVDLRSNSTS
jgi:class 3 adenylate cyclase/predicted ATPase